jgi:hypothetical protein
MRSDVMPEKKRSVLKDFLGKECPTCGCTKRSGMSHCSLCYGRLPKPMQTALYKRFGEGYEEAFATSCAWLA